MDITFHISQLWHGNYNVPYYRIFGGVVGPKVPGQVGHERVSEPLPEAT